MSSTFQVSPSETPIPSPCLYEGAAPPTHSRPPDLAFPYSGASNTPGPRASPPTDVQQGHPLPHMQPAPWVPPCAFFGWCSCSSLHGAANPFSSFIPFSNSCIRDPKLSPTVGCELPPLSLSGSGRASQETAISGSCQQALVGIHNSV